MDVKIVICDRCLLPILEPGPHAIVGVEDLPYVTACRHVYHYMCMYNMHTYATQIDNHNTRIVTCVHPWCSKRILVNEFSRLHLSTNCIRKVTPPAASTSRIEELKQQTRLQLETIENLRMVATSLADQTRTMEIKYTEAFKELKDMETGYNLDLVIDQQQRIGQYFIPGPVQPIVGPMSFPYSSNSSTTISISTYQGNQSSNVRNSKPASTGEIPALMGVSASVFEPAQFNRTLDNKTMTFDSPPLPPSPPPPPPPPPPYESGTSSGSLTECYRPYRGGIRYRGAGIQRHRGTGEHRMLKGDDHETKMSWNQSPLNQLYPPPQHPGYESNGSLTESYRSFHSRPYSRGIRSRDAGIQRRGSGDHRILRQSASHESRPASKPALVVATEPQKCKRGTLEEFGIQHRLYKQRFGTDSSEIQPFYPIDSYPHLFTAAAHKYRQDEIVVLFAYQILIVGDGHAVGLAKCLADGKPFQNSLDTDLYRRNLLASELVRGLSNLSQLPKKIMISIGNFDVTCKTSYTDYNNEMVKLLHLLKERQVEEVYTLPLIKHPNQDEVVFELINFSLYGLRYGWELSTEGRTFRMDSMFEELNAIVPNIDELGPFYDINEYEKIRDKIAEKYIPLPVNNLRPKLDAGTKLAPPTKDPRKIQTLDVKKTVENIEKKSISSDCKTDPSNETSKTILNQEINDKQFVRSSATIKQGIRNEKRKQEEIAQQAEIKKMKN